ncbi:hypothetical protein J6590_075916 [Homalodisca vitripennis]|nr:hypothetical protein J6590_075916 [Homalodisca vitripennis]
MKLGNLTSEFNQSPNRSYPLIWPTPKRGPGGVGPIEPKASLANCLSVPPIMRTSRVRIVAVSISYMGECRSVIVRILIHWDYCSRDILLTTPTKICKFISTKIEFH